MQPVLDTREARLQLTHLSRHLLRRLPLTHRGAELWPLVQHLSAALNHARVTILLRDDTSQFYREAAASYPREDALVLPDEIHKYWHEDLAKGRFFQRNPSTEPNWLRVSLDREEVATCLPLRASGRSVGLILFGPVPFFDVSAVRTLLDDIGHETATMLESIRLREVAATDSLTKLPRRHVIEDRLTHDIERAARSGAPVSVVMVDLDNFKRINDDFGHHCGDIVLQDVAMILQSAGRRVDMAGRWGGEEFLLVLADTDADGARCAAEKLRIAIEQHRFEEGQHSFSMTASFGVAQLEAAVETEAHQLIARADRALYVAKRSGRNRVHIDAFSAETGTE